MGLQGSYIWNGASCKVRHGIIHDVCAHDGVARLPCDKQAIVAFETMNQLLTHRLCQPQVLVVKALDVANVTPVALEAIGLVVVVCVYCVCIVCVL